MPRKKHCPGERDKMSFDFQPTLTGSLVELRPLRQKDDGDLFAVASDPLIWEQHPVRRQRSGFLSIRDHFRLLDSAAFIDASAALPTVTSEGSLWGRG